MTEEAALGARYTWGSDEHLFVEIAEEMSLGACFRAMSIARGLAGERLDGVLAICPANASYQVRFDPDVLAPTRLLSVAHEVEQRVGEGRNLEIETRIVEVPVLYDDPWTRETLERFPENRQRRDLTDLEFVAGVNGFTDVDALIAAHHTSPWLVSMVGFVAGLPFLYQMVSREHQIEAPKYIRPRTDTPAGTVALGGCFGSIYSVRGAGGYQMFGITPLPIYDPRQELADFQESVCFFRPGDIVKFVPLTRERYDDLYEAARRNEAPIRRGAVGFNVAEFEADSTGTNRRLIEVLDGD